MTSSTPYHFDCVAVASVNSLLHVYFDYVPFCYFGKAKMKLKVNERGEERKNSSSSSTKTKRTYIKRFNKIHPLGNRLT